MPHARKGPSMCPSLSSLKPQPRVVPIRPGVFPKAGQVPSAPPGWDPSDAAPEGGPDGQASRARVEPTSGALETSGARPAGTLDGWTCGRHGVRWEHLVHVPGKGGGKSPGGVRARSQPHEYDGGEPPPPPPPLAPPLGPPPGPPPAKVPPVAPPSVAKPPVAQQPGALPPGPLPPGALPPGPLPPLGPPPLPPPPLEDYAVMTTTASKNAPPSPPSSLRRSTSVSLRRRRVVGHTEARLARGGFGWMWSETVPSSEPDGQVDEPSRKRRSPHEETTEPTASRARCGSFRAVLSTGKGPRRLIFIRRSGRNRRVCSVHLLSLCEGT
eukprot:g33117.t1